jgi:alpha-glucosidase
MSKLRCVAIALLLFIVLPTAVAQKRETDAEGHPWWQHAVFYEIYPRSFADSNGDGIGDLKGITGRLEYLKALGIDAIWLTPCYPSPQVDFGYDVSDYQNIDPMYGTLKDFDNLAKEARKRKIRIIMDFVLNHTSDQHKWFQASRSSRTSPFRDWYVWRDGKGPGQPPNNWISLFGGSAWKLDPATGQYYYHMFYPEQPDLNWRNPAVKQAMFDITRWWYKRGVAGFRLDAVNTLFEDPQLRDNPELGEKNAYGDTEQKTVYNSDLPQVHTILQELRQVADENDAVLIGETWTEDAEQLRAYYGPSHNELQLPMDFMFTMINKLSPPDFRKQIAGAEASGGWPVYVISNHDIRRSYDRYGDGKNNDAIAKLLASLYLTLRGTPIMYYGEEIGMENNDPARIQDVQDPIGKKGWPEEKGRDGERTPMQWNASPNAGFTPGRPWLPVPASYKTRNVESELADPNSILNFYKKLLALRRKSPALLDGKYVPLNQQDPHVLAYLRQSASGSVLVVLNMSTTPQKAGFDLSAQGLGTTATPLLTSLSTGPGTFSLPEMELAPLGAYILQVGK